MLLTLVTCSRFDLFLLSFMSTGSTFSYYKFLHSFCFKKECTRLFFWKISPLLISIIFIPLFLRVPISLRCKRMGTATALDTFVLDGRIILKWILEKQVKKVVDWISLVRGRDKLCIVVKVVLLTQFPSDPGNWLNNWGTFIFAPCIRESIYSSLTNKCTFYWTWKSLNLHEITHNYRSYMFRSSTILR